MLYVLHRAFNMTNGVHMGIAMYIPVFSFLHHRIVDIHMHIMLALSCYGHELTVETLPFRHTDCL